MQNPNFMFHFRLFCFNAGGIYREILPKAEYFSKALYTFDIGQNDLTMGYFANMTTEQVEAYIPDLMERFTAAIQVQFMLNIYFSSQPSYTHTHSSNCNAHGLLA